MIYRLKYIDKETALIDLKSKEVIDNKGKYINGTESVVECGIITLVYGTFDEYENEITPAIIAEGYHYDIMTNKILTFESEIFPNNPKYQFFGHK